MFFLVNRSHKWHIWLGSISIFWMKVFKWNFTLKLWICNYEVQKYNFKDTRNVQVLIMNLVDRYQQVSIDKYDENAFLCFEQRRPQLPQLVIGLLITISWLLFLSTSSSLHIEWFSPSPQPFIQGDSPPKDTHLEEQQLPQTFSLSLDWNFILFQCLPYSPENCFVSPANPNTVSPQYSPVKSPLPRWCGSVSSSAF